MACSTRKARPPSLAACAVSGESERIRRRSSHAGLAS